MNLSNPVQFQKFNFKILNDHRIRGLLNQRISNKREEFHINQFVTIQNSPERGENSSKLIIPSNAHVYKVVSINKNGFQLTLMNISTGARQEIVHSKVKKLSLDTLENISFARPQLYDKLVQLRRKLRNTYESGTRTSHNLHQVPFSEPMIQGANQKEDQDTGESAEDDDLVREEDEEEEINDHFRPSFDNPEEEGLQADQNEEVPENTRIT